MTGRFLGFALFFADRLDRAVGDGIVNFSLVAVRNNSGFAVVIELEDRAVAADAKTAANAGVLVNFRFLVSHFDFPPKIFAIIKADRKKGNKRKKGLPYGFKKRFYSFRINAMETRMEKYRKYREEIRHMAEESFPQAKAKLSASPQKVELEDDAPLGKNSPYYLYAKRLRKRTLILLGTFALLIVGFIVWFFLLQGRKV